MYILFNSNYIHYYKYFSCFLICNVYLPSDVITQLLEAGIANAICFFYAHLSIINKVVNWQVSCLMRYDGLAGRREGAESASRNPRAAELEQRREGGEPRYGQGRLRLSTLLRQQWTSGRAGLQVHRTVQPHQQHACF